MPRWTPAGEVVRNVNLDVQALALGRASRVGREVQWDDRVGNGPSLVATG